MKYILITAFFLGQCGLMAQDYPLVYEQDFENPVSDQFYYTDSNAWRFKDGSMELYGKSDYQPPFRSPLNIAILRDLIVGDFELVVDLKQTGREYGHRDMCLFFGINNPSNFYYVHLASVADQNAHNIFLVNDSARTNIAYRTTSGIEWKDQWNTVKIKRSSQDSLIQVYFNDMDQPIMEAKDLHFPAGRIGFGSFDDTGKVDNIKIKGIRTSLPSFF